MEKIVANIAVEFVAAKVDGFTTVAAHYIVCSCQSSAIGEWDVTVKNASLYEAVKSVKALVAAAVSDKTGEKVTEWQVKDGRTTYTGFDAKALAEFMASDEKEAHRENARMADEAKQHAVVVRFEAEKKANVTVGSTHVHLDTYTNNRVTVEGVRRWSTYSPKSESVIAERRFNRNSKGTWNWAEIQSAARRVAQYLENETTVENAKKSGEAKSAALLKAAGLDGQGNVRLGSNGGLTVSFEVKDLATLKAALNNLAAMGITLK